MDYREKDNNSNKKCYYYLKKNGKSIYKFIHNEINCVINNITYYEIIYFPNLFAKNEKDILEKLLMIHSAKKNNLKYYQINEKFKTDKIHGMQYYIFKEENMDKLINLCFYKKYISENNDFHLFFYKTDIKMYSTLFLLHKIMYFNISNNKILNQIFYENYIREIEYEIYEKYGKKLNDFPNYYKLYLFLKSVGEVDLFYKNYSKKFIKNYNKFYLKYISLKNNYEYKNFEKKFRKKIKNFKDINILNIIENNISDKFDKKYIKNKFLELTKNNKKL